MIVLPAHELRYSTEILFPFPQQIGEVLVLYRAILIDCLDVTAKCCWRIHVPFRELSGLCTGRGVPVTGMEDRPFD
jgi:hypothetical protein